MKFVASAVLFASGPVNLTAGEERPFKAEINGLALGNPCGIVTDAVGTSAHFGAITQDGEYCGNFLLMRSSITRAENSFCRYKWRTPNTISISFLRISNEARQRNFGQEPGGASAIRVYLLSRASKHFSGFAPGTPDCRLVSRVWHGEIFYSCNY